MKKFVVLSGLCVMSIGLFAQATKKPVAAKKPATPAAAPVVMKNALDSFSYAMGLSIATFYKEQGVQNINSSLVVKASW